MMVLPCCFQDHVPPILFGAGVRGQRLHALVMKKLINSVLTRLDRYSCILYSIYKGC